ncbi:MAG: hypothetical protein NVSMB21_14640 [Vulcanimicrobiaceae bacterium]
MSTVPSGAFDNGQKTPWSAESIVRRARVGGDGFGDTLDIGCGDGTILRTLAPYAASLAGVDVRADRIDLARRALPDAELAVASIEDGLSLQRSTFDTIFMCDVIEHLRQPILALEHIRALLRPGGRFVITTPNSGSLMRVVKGAKWFGVQDPSHLLFFSRFTLAHLLKQCGFEIETATTVGLTGSRIADFGLRLLRDGGTILIVARAGA